MTSSVKGLSVRGVLFWLFMAALFAFPLAACTQATAADIPTATQNQETTPADTNPAAVEWEDTSANMVTADESQEMTEGEPEDTALAFARCMRENGVNDFPDPDPNTGGGIVMRAGGPGGMNPNNARFQEAMEVCQHLRPSGIVGPDSGAQGGMDDETALAFSRCMRENGVPDFPDPGAEGGFAVSDGRVMIRAGEGSGIDPNNPRFQSAMETCTGILQGAAP